MKALHLRNQRGFTLVAQLALIAVLTTAATMVAIQIFYVSRSRLRSDSKTSVLTTHDLIVKMLLRRFVAVTTPTCPSDLATFRDRFKSTPITFPGSNTSLFLVTGVTSTELGPLASFPTPNLPDIAAALANCKSATSLKVPSNTAQEPYLFCVALENPESKTYTNFIDSEGAFIQVRLDLLSSEMNQTEKQFGAPLSCNDWVSRQAQRQFKITYRIFWKRRKDEAFFSYMGSQIVDIYAVQ